jgi:hypothetical protein
MSKYKNPVRQALSDVAGVVRDTGRAVRKSFSTEYVHTTIEGVIDDLESRYPQGGKGAHKLSIARTLLGGILGDDYVTNRWAFISTLISQIVALKKA